MNFTMRTWSRALTLKRCLAYLQRMRPDVSNTFLENKAYFQQVLEEVESGEAVLLEHDEVWEEIDRQTT